jgi:hypothetical protein
MGIATTALPEPPKSRHTYGSNYKFNFGKSEHRQQE